MLYRSKVTFFALKEKNFQLFKAMDQPGHLTSVIKITVGKAFQKL